jgi:hypothetical protein
MTEENTLVVEPTEVILLPRAGMAHEIAKLMLEHAGTFLERAEAIRVAISLGMPLNDIEEYLDWLDTGSVTRPREGGGRA